MNIKQAKQEISDALRAYLTRDELGNYLIPSIRQRPILLMGPPGIGKTQIMAQIAAESGVGLVSYTITHHTRQSAMGLPFISKRVYDGAEYSVTEYTMSEILASVHDLMEKTGIREGILFLDEINCVSETLAPMMLQFLQCKTFGNQRLPDGWMIVAAGNPPEYNRSVREFDVVTLDRVRKIDVREDFGVWKEYATRKGLHGAVVSYLDIRRENFYGVETTVDGIEFATARGWEDLSELLTVCEKIGVKVGRDTIGEYIQLPRIARNFANYLELYNKYRKSYRVEEVLQGHWQPVTVSELREAPFDEKLSVMGLLLSRLTDSAKTVWRQDGFTSALHTALTEFREHLPEEEPDTILEALSQRRRDKLRQAREAGHLDPETRDALQREIGALDDYRTRIRGGVFPNRDAVMDAVRAWFGEEVTRREQFADETGKQFDNAFRFLEEAVGEAQELVLFVTEITSGYHLSWYVENFGCDAYFRHNRELLFDDRKRQLREKIVRAVNAETEA